MCPNCVKFALYIWTMIDQFTIDKIFNAAQITEVVSDFVTLKKRGVNYVGLCPFHNDSTPSFYVSPSKNICKCFACGEGGNPVQFIMKHEQVGYHEALRYLAKKYFIEIKERELSDEEKQMRSDRESMMIVNSWAQKFFSSRLYDHDEGRTVGLSYFVERGFREDIIRKFQLGYCLNKRNDLYNHALEQGYSEAYLLKTGLVYKRDDGAIADRFHGRVIFPVHTMSGKVVAFGGRILGKKDKVAKYVNSPESEIYHKSNELFGIFFAKQAIAKADKCFLVEGYTDVISMYQTGVENVVASSGTALTSFQIRLIRRLTNNITVIYDGDAAGIKAAIRGIDMLLEEGMHVKIVQLPEGEDPDSFARSHNSFDFTLFIKENEVDFIRFKSNLLLKESVNDPIQKANLIKDIMKSVAFIPDNIVRSVYIKECSQLLEESEQVLLNEVMTIRNRVKFDIQRQKDRGPREIAMPPKEAASPKDELTEPDEKAHEAIIPVPKKQYLFKKYETALIRYVINYGERNLFKMQIQDTDDVSSEIKVAEYIRTELAYDEIEIQWPVYKQILDEAVANCENETFVASQYFLTHANLEINELATNMLISRYQISKYFQDSNDFALIQTTRTDAQQKEGIEERKKEKEREQLERWVMHGIFALKNAHIKHEIEEINKQIKTFQSDEETVKDLFVKRMKLDEIKCLLGKELGDRVVTGL